MSGIARLVIGVSPYKARNRFEKSRPGKRGTIVRDVSRNGVRGEVIWISGSKVGIRMADGGLRIIDERNIAIHGEPEPKPQTKFDKPQYSDDVLRLARMCGLTPEEVIEAMR
jgi:hypothetical protein